MAGVETIWELHTLPPINSCHRTFVLKGVLGMFTVFATGRYYRMYSNWVQDYSADLAQGGLEVPCSPALRLQLISIAWTKIVSDKTLLNWLHSRKCM